MRHHWAMLKPWIIALTLAGSQAVSQGELQDEFQAATCPAPPDHSAALNRLLDRVQAAGSESQARQISDQMWALWASAPDEIAQEILNAGMAKRASYDLLGARQAFDRLIAYCPDYAEGYNQRAFVNFIRQDYSASLTDLERTLALSPRHLGAMTGKALALMGLGRMDEGQQVLRAALALNPWLPERHLLTPRGEEL